MPSIVPIPSTINILSPTVNNTMPITGEVHAEPAPQDEGGPKVQLLPRKSYPISNTSVPLEIGSTTPKHTPQPPLLKPRIEELDFGEEVDTPDHIVTSISTAPITQRHQPYTPLSGTKLHHAGTARANTAPSQEHPYGTTENDYARKHAHQTVLQQHCAFFDPDNDGIIWPHNTFYGFYILGYGVILSIIAVLVIHSNFSYPTLDSWIPDPFFRLYIKNIHMDKHGSDTNTYDHEGRYIPQKFEDIFAKYAGGREYITIWEVARMLRGQRCIADPIGWGGAFFECKWCMVGF
jgi:hypothetical protein